MISIGAIFKNECPFIIEWLAYHMTLGITDFHIADNISTDGSSELLYYLDKTGLIKRIEYPTQDNTPPQLGAYEKILSTLDDNKWIAFIDADEFIAPRDYEDGLEPLNSLLCNKENGAISLNWAVYGSSHSILPDSGLVIDRFTKRAAEDHPVNKHYKSIVRAGDVVSTGTNPHAFKIKPEKRFIIPNGAVQQHVDGISEVIDWSIIRLNHYVIKSKSEFFNKKAARGRATTLKESAGRNAKFFSNHDLNNVEESIPFWFSRKVQSQIKYIEKILIENGYQLNAKTVGDVLYRTSKNMGSGFIDTLNKNDNTITLKGWAVDDFKRPCHDIVVVINNSILLHTNNISFHDRPDVQRAGVGNGIGCGFISSVTLPNIHIADIQIYATNKSEIACVEFKISEQLTAILV